MKTDKPKSKYAAPSVDVNAVDKERITNLMESIKAPESGGTLSSDKKIEPPKEK